MKFFQSIFVALIIVVFCFGLAGSPVRAQQPAQAGTQALIAVIQQQLNQLEEQLNQQIASWCYGFTKNLGVANSGTEDVENLHLALDREGISYGPDGFNVYSTGTSQAVIQFQAKYKISPQSGYVGPLTRAKLNALYDVCSTKCTPNWKCSTWNTCYGSQQSRTCYDANNCGVITKEPSLTQSCGTKPACTKNSDCGSAGYSGSSFCQANNVYQVYLTHICGNPGQSTAYCTTSTAPQLKTTCNNNQVCSKGSCTTLTTCKPSWSCSGFSKCVNGVQTQTCTDKNNCHDATGQPSLARACTK